MKGGGRGEGYSVYEEIKTNAESLNPHPLTTPFLHPLCMAKFVNTMFLLNCNFVCQLKFGVLHHQLHYPGLFNLGKYVVKYMLEVRDSATKKGFIFYNY